jgi:hypothetical protein
VQDVLGAIRKKMPGAGIKIREAVKTGTDLITGDEKYQMMFVTVHDLSVVQGVRYHRL